MVILTLVLVDRLSHFDRLGHYTHFCIIFSSSFDRRWFGFKARDCVNGTLMPRKHLPSLGANYTLIHHLFQKYGLQNKLDVDVEKIPYETDITIYNRTKVS